MLVGWALWTLVLAPSAPPLVKPLEVSLLHPETAQPEREPTPPHPHPPRPVAAPMAAMPPPVPDLLHEPRTTTAPAQAVPLAPSLASSAAPSEAAATAAPAPPAEATAPPPKPAPPTLLRADQVRYLVMPPAELPVLSRRAGESGVVWLRVRIDAQGRPARIALHRSSGFRRLDEQALAAMAQARFAPQLAGGVAVEAEVIAPIEYAVD